MSKSRFQFMNANSGSTYQQRNVETSKSAVYSIWYRRRINTSEWMSGNGRAVHRGDIRAEDTIVAVLREETPTGHKPWRTAYN